MSSQAMMLEDLISQFKLNQGGAFGKGLPPAAKPAREQYTPPSDSGFGTGPGIGSTGEFGKY
jgi:hypothetical protein